MAEKRAEINRPKIIPGDWHAELLAAGSVHLGGAVNQSPAPHAIEFSWISFPALAHGPNKVGLPAVVVLMAPAETVVHEHPGAIMRNGLMTMIDLFVTRPPFSDLLPQIECGRLNVIRFKVEEGSDQKWPISYWGATLKPANRKTKAKPMYRARHGKIGRNNKTVTISRASFVYGYQPNNSSRLPAGCDRRYR